MCFQYPAESVPDALTALTLGNGVLDRLMSGNAREALAKSATMYDWARDLNCPFS